MTDLATPAAPAATDAPAAPTAPVAQPAAADILTAPAPAAAPTSPYDQDTSGWLQNRGYHELEGINTPAAVAVVKQTRELERLRGVSADKIVQLPDDLSQPGALDPIYAKLGRPAEPGGYQFPSDPAGEETEFRAWASPIFHQAGLSNSQANALYSALKSGAEAEDAAALEVTQQEQTADLAALKAEWKDSYDLNVQIARNVVAKAGADTETIRALEGALGNAGVIKFLASIGGRMGEASFVNGGTAPMGATTPEAAKQKLSELTTDIEFAKKVQAGDAEASALITRLSKIAAGASPVSV